MTHTRIVVNLERCLQEADVSGRELARRIPCHHDTISKLRSGRTRTVNLDFLQRCAEALGVPVRDMLVLRREPDQE